MAKQASDAWHAIKRGHWDLHQIHAFAWTPGKPAAERVKRAMATRLADKRQFENPEWYDMTAAEAIDCMEKIARAERVELFDEVERQRRLERQTRAGTERKIAAFEHPRRQLPPPIPRLVKG